MQMVEHVINRDDDMATFEIDVVTMTDGNVLSLKKDDILLGVKSDGTEFYVLRKVFMG